jgi:poly-gamma-glutamate synthesis protein (capsule biosynthesis protein)
MGVTLTISKENITYEKHYFEQFNQEPIVKLINANELPYNVDELSKKISSDEILYENFNRFVSQKSRLYNSYIEPVKSKYLLALINRGITPSFWNKKKLKVLSNLITCESHREVLTKVLKQK